MRIESWAVVFWGCKLTRLALTRTSWSVRCCITSVLPIQTAHTHTHTHTHTLLCSPLSPRLPLPKRSLKDPQAPSHQVCVCVCVCVCVKRWCWFPPINRMLQKRYWTWFSHFDCLAAEQEVRATQAVIAMQSQKAPPPGSKEADSNSILNNMNEAINGRAVSINCFVLIRLALQGLCCVLFCHVWRRACLLAEQTLNLTLSTNTTCISPWPCRQCWVLCLLSAES